jgi:DNA-binding response OmpR family regulator
MYQRQFNVLVLDEDTRGLYQTVALLKQRDYVVFGAPAVDIAAWMLSQWPFDLLVAALRLGEMNGLDFVSGARRHHPALASVLLGCEGDEVLEADAWQLEASVLIRPVNPALFLTVVAERLAAIRGRQRWPRKNVTANVPVSVDGAPARLVDVSYGGFRLALNNDKLSSPMTVAFPAAGLRLRAHLVWSSLARDGVTCLCGAALAEDAPMADWRRFVDWIPENVQ